MAKTIVGGGGGNSHLTANSTTVFYSLGQNSHQSSTAGGNEARREHHMMHAGTFSRFSIYLSENSRSTTTTVSFRVNGADGNQVIAVPAGVSGQFSDAVNTDTVSIGDRVCWAVTTGTGGGTFGIGSGCQVVAFDAAGGETVGIYASQPANDNYAINFFFGDGFFSIAGLNDGGTVTAADFKMKAGTFSGLEVYVVTNARNADCTFETVATGGSGDCSIVIPALTSGHFQDTTGSGVLDEQDTLRARITSAGGNGPGTITLGRAGIEVEFVDEAFNVYTYDSNTDLDINNGMFLRPIGERGNHTTEVNRQMRVPFDLKVTRIEVSYSTGASGSDHTITLRKNGVDTSLAVLCDVPASGAYRSANGEVLFSEGDLLSWGVTSPGSAIVSLDLLNVIMEASGAPSTVTPEVGHLELEGYAATLASSAVIQAPGGELELEGHAARVAEVFKVYPPGGELEIDGHGAAIIAGGTVAPGAGELVITGYRALINESVASQVAILALTEPPPPEVRDSELVLLVAGEVVPATRASQQAVMILADAEPCVTQRCQLWKIKRRDGVILTFTSHDQDVLWGDGRTYKACNSLNPSASESASNLGSVGNIELEGLISHDDITEEDLYGGLYDDAFVEVWLVSWADVTDTPKRLAAGWTGELSQGESGFRMEVVGPGARLEQQALVQQYTPGCRRVFGSPQGELAPGGCGVNIEALKVSGIVQDAPNRGVFAADVAASSAPSQWPNGKVTWTSGRNAGTTQEVKTVDFGSGVIVLWVPAPFLPEYGDTFDLYPGCDLAKLGGCTVYDNVVNFGGFPDVPGPDALMETPDAKY